MNNTLMTPTENELANAVQENLFALFRAMVEVLPGSEIEETGKLSRHLTSPTNPMFKGAWRTRLKEDEADAVIDETIAWFRARNAPYFFWWTGPGTTPANLGARLQARGLLDMAEQQKLAYFRPERRFKMNSWCYAVRRLSGQCSALLVSKPKTHGETTNEKPVK